MLNRVMLSTLSLTTLTCVVTWPVHAIAAIGPQSESSRTSIQLSSGVLTPTPLVNAPPFVEQPADDLSGLMITGCSQMGSGGPQVCLQWLGDALTTCLEWGDESVITACMQRGNASGGVSSGDSQDGIYESSSAGHPSSQSDWGFSLEFILQ